MKIENVSEGQIIKNYKALCSELEVPVEAGNSKKAQLKEWERYFGYQKQGNKFIITDIYETPKEKVDGRGKSGDYVNHLELFIADMLANSKDKHISISRTRFLIAMNMVNNNYGECNKYIDQLSKFTNIEKIVIHDFYNTTNSNLKYAIETALDRLQSKRVITWKKVIKICDKEDEGNHRVATQDEEDMIKFKYEKEVLEKMPKGYREIKTLRISKYWKKFQTEVQKNLDKETHIKYYYLAYFFSINQDYIEAERDDLKKLIMDNKEKHEARKKINQSVQNNLYKNADKRCSDAIEAKGKFKDYRFDFEYPDKIKKLIDLLVNEKQSDITYRLQKLTNKKVEQS
ncbi:hypothetical protein M3690_04155 [Priestia megaterium]|uniref:hypothetical protein n=1 Tax=Priestia megaterium TaxID=1404 RepID=UPI00203FB6C0|nr:hypothetical protein [Priestia megaterium]MCM3792484.1 hypothetical protein [Priestia megaterium]